MKIITKNGQIYTTGKDGNRKPLFKTVDLVFVTEEDNKSFYATERYQAIASEQELMQQRGLI